MSTQAYDALGFDPAPGVSASVQQLVATLSKVGNQLSTAHGTLTKVGKTDGVWEGDAASGFAKKVGELPKYLSGGHSSLTDAAQALNQWHSRLSDFQVLAARYEREAEEARRVLKEAHANPDLGLVGKTFDSETALDNAQKRLDYAVKRVNEATRTPSSRRPRIYSVTTRKPRGPLPKPFAEPPRAPRTSRVSSTVSWMRSKASATRSRIWPGISGSGYRSTPTRSTRSVTGLAWRPQHAMCWPSSSPRR
ncbi:hypothetical protein [Streptomyces sp. NPDC005374]|uniref:hypothetical protein n=1 Tax=Streptomyces sp. NPDC005374 TaxID=3364713 RepID=UPI003688BFE1